MESERGTFDRELDSSPGRPRRNRPASLEECQRIIVNPFLAVTAWVAAFALVRESIQTRSLPLLEVGIVLLFVAFLLFQFHCMDCGATDWLSRYRSHACSAVVLRSQNHEVRRYTRPGVKTQLIAWFAVTATALVLGMIVYLSRQ